MYDKFHYLLSDNLEWWHRNGFLRASAEAIGRKMGDPNNLVAAFIDCNCLPSNVTGGGPTEEGANAARWDPLTNQAFYNGWKSIHGLKHQSVDIAYGFSIDLHGPASLRRNDLSLLRRSNVNDRFRDVQRPNLRTHYLASISVYWHRFWPEISSNWVLAKPSYQPS